MKDYPYMIKKVLNNNVVISEDQDSKEIIIMGSGIGFHKHVREYVDSSKIFKIYDLRSNAFRNRFEALINEIPFECFQLSERIIDYAKNTLQKEFNQNLILGLADHINFAVYQYQNGQRHATLMNEEIRRFYKEEYHVGEDAVKMINEFYQIRMSPDEAASIAFHLINAESNQNADDTTKILNGTHDILQIIEKSLHIKLREDTLSYSRLVLHLKYFIKRALIEGESCDDELGRILFNEDDEQYRKVSACLDTIEVYLTEKYQYSMVESERVYLLLHITRVLQTNQKGE